MRKHFIARVATGHRVTIPNEVCQILGIKDGNLVDVDLDVIVVLPKIEDKLAGGQ